MPITHYQNISSSYQRRQRNRRIIEVIILVVFIVIPSLLLLIDKKALLNKVLSLKPGSSGFETWLNPPIKTTRNYYLFNTTNAQEFLEKAKVPLHVADSPPYTYELKTNRKGIKWSDDNKTMSYEIERIYIRDPTLFNPTSINDRGNFTNMVRTLIRSKFENIPSLATKIALEGEPPFRDNPIEILEGYVSTASKEVQKQMKGPNTDKYGLVYRQNGSRLYNMTIKTDLFEKGQMLAFASELSPFVISSSNNSHFPVYDGLTFPPMLWDRPKMNIFNSDFCRPVRIEYNGTISKFGISTIHKYILKLIDFNNCTDPNDDRTCPEVDEIDVSKCLSETLDKKTIVLSKAHFYGSSSEFVDNLNIKGFNASAEKHDSIIYFEPYTGTPIEAIYRIQMNVNAKVDSMKVNDEGNYDFKWKKCETRTLPVFWIEQRVQLLDEKLKQIRVFSLLMNLLTPWKLFPIFIGLGSLIVIIMEVIAKFRP